MFNGGPHERERRDSYTNLHNTQQHDGENREHSDGSPTRVEGTPAEHDVPERYEGTWGERDVGGPLNQGNSMQDYEQLRRELTQLSLIQSGASNKMRPKSTRKTTGTLEEAENGEGAAEEDDFELDQFMREGHFEKRKDGVSAKKVGVVFKNLNVKGIASQTTYVKTLPDAIVGTFGPDLYRLLSRFLPFLRFASRQPTKDLIHDFTGIIRDGEMMLVLGRPGAGCTTFLKAIANNRDGYASVTGDVSYGGIPADVQKKHYRGEVNYNPEDDVHMPEMNVYQTFLFALLNKTKKREKGEIPIVINALLRMFGISHTKWTQVGNEYVRGISGGERKRVSIAETLATKSTVLCWDNSTRGLDASTALDYAKSLRIMTDVSRRTTVTTLYQAGEGIYEQMDKVLLIDSGKMIYQGPAKEARQYFIDLGFQAPERQTTADFLTACTDPVERQFREGFEKSCPKSPEELEAAFKASAAYKKVLQEVSDYEQQLKDSNMADAREFEETVQEGKSHRTVSKSSNYTVSFWRQVLACVVREYWLIIGDTTTLYTKYFIIISNALIVGSLFYGQSLDTSGAFSRGGALFFAMVFLGWLQLSELMKALTGREVVARQRDYAFNHPAAVSIARVLVDFVQLLPQVLVFGLVIYFMASLDVDASKFWIFMLFAYLMTLNITALYRMFAALSPSIDDAVRFSGIALVILIVYTGYVIPKPQLTSQYIWFGWLYYIDPISYAFEAVLSNEFSDRLMECSPSQLVPQGPGTDPAHQGCALSGSPPNSRTVPGADYLYGSFTYTRSHLWRNFGVVIAFTVLYILVTAFATEVFDFSKKGGGALVYVKHYLSKNKKAAAAPVADEEKAGKAEDSSSSSDRGALGTTKSEEETLEEISSSKSIFTWKDVSYSVPYQGGERQLLNNVDGYAKPGVMIALMGASGAGKTTLLNTLSQRQFMGTVSGSMLVDGKPLGATFQRQTGFCEQMDLHDGTASIREALEFSALLRQERHVSRAEKLAYVDKVIDLLELHDIQDAIVSSLGVEQRKRLTIGVELAAKPSLLLFLDEPTSGLDSQSAFSIIRFLKKLSHAGQAIVCTIHQPSSVLIEQFDMILALNPGGNTFYFGNVGEHGSDVIKYFADRGFECPPRKNIAEFILETAAKSRRRADGTKVDWNAEWKSSEEAKAIRKQIEDMEEDRKSQPEIKTDAGHAFAAPLWTQTLELTKRTFRQHWRDPSYLYGKLFVSVIVGIFNGFTFYMLGNTRTDMQNRMFSAFLIIIIPPAILNAVIPKFFQNMMLWMAREHPSRIYNWFAFSTAQVVCEIPIATLCSVLYFCLWYYPAALPRDSSTAGYVFLMTLLWNFFQASWGQWITAFAPSFTVISNVLPFFLVMVSLFNGVVRPYAQLPVFWRYWMYYVNPSTYWLGGVLGATLDGIPVRCAPEETAKFTPPPGQTCFTYAGDYAMRVGGQFLDANSTTLCEFCQLTTGNQYLAQLNIKSSEKWRDFGIFLAFVISNWALVYFFIYTVRVKGWSFGFGIVFGFLGKVADAITAPFKKMIEDRRAKEDGKGTTTEPAEEE